MKMNRTMIGLMILTLKALGCSHATVHDKCSQPDTLSHYKDYDQCYAELSHKERNKKNVFQGFADGYNNAMRAQNSGGGQNCHGTTDNVGYTRITCE
jgi:hypothetical protein